MPKDALYDAVVRSVHPHAIGAMIVRLITTHVVFVAFSYPLWRKVFRTAPTPA